MASRKASLAFQLKLPTSISISAPIYSHRPYKRVCSYIGFSLSLYRLSLAPPPFLLFSPVNLSLLLSPSSTPYSPRFTDVCALVGGHDLTRTRKRSRQVPARISPAFCSPSRKILRSGPRAEFLFLRHR